MFVLYIGCLKFIKCHFKVLKLLSLLQNEISFFLNLLGIKDDVGSKSIDELNPSTKEEFLELSQLIVGKLSNYEVMIMLCEVIHQL